MVNMDNVVWTQCWETVDVVHYIFNVLLVGVTSSDMGSIRIEKRGSKFADEPRVTAALTATLT
jgi:hypothetical protein